eukprot:scaffold405_cov243-Pinguiococcus_pyrenoidosus.AAC.6
MKRRSISSGLRFTAAAASPSAASSTFPSVHESMLLVGPSPRHEDDRQTLLQELFTLGFGACDAIRVCRQSLWSLE